MDWSSGAQVQDLSEVQVPRLCSTVPGQLLDGGTARFVAELSLWMVLVRVRLGYKTLIVIFLWQLLLSISIDLVFPRFLGWAVDRCFHQI